LPHEPQSAAELLAASHLSTVELTALAATAWAKGPDGLEHRRQTMDFRLLERFKGDLDVKAGDPLAAEQVFAASHGDPARLDAAVTLVGSAYAERARVRGLFGQFVWARVEPEYATGEDRLYPLLIKIVAAKDATVDLRQSLIDGLCPKVTENGAANARAVDFAHVLLGLLLQPEAAPLMDISGARGDPRSGRARRDEIGPGQVSLAARERDRGLARQLVGVQAASRARRPRRTER